MSGEESNNINTAAHNPRAHVYSLENSTNITKCSFLPDTDARRTLQVSLPQTPSDESQ